MSAAPEDALTISFKALTRARSTLEDFAFSYFPLHGLKLPEDLLAHLDVLVWVEASIYQLDEDNEALTARGGSDVRSVAAGMSRIRAVLRGRGLLDEALDAELRAGERYWCEEQSIAAALLAAPTPLRAPAPLREAQVVACHEAKSFDYRVLHRLLFRLTGRPYDDALLAFLEVDERLVDLGDDLTDYEDDVCANSFNILRCFIHLYGRDAQLKLAERIGRLEAAHAAALQRLPAAAQEAYWRRHKAACAGQGSDRWVFPPPIYDEASYRCTYGGGGGEGSGIGMEEAEGAQQRQHQQQEAAAADGGSAG